MNQLLRTAQAGSSTEDYAADQMKLSEGAAPTIPTFFSQRSEMLREQEA